MRDQYAFAGFVLQPDRRVLLHGNETVRLGGRAFDVLCILVHHAGETISQREIVAAVWEDRTTDGATLRVHMTALRRALGDSAREPSFIINHTGRGYRFIMPVERRTGLASGHG